MNKAILNMSERELAAYNMGAIRARRIVSMDTARRAKRHGQTDLMRWSVEWAMGWHHEVMDIRRRYFAG